MKHQLLWAGLVSSSLCGWLSATEPAIQPPAAKPAASPPAALPPAAETVSERLSAVLAEPEFAHAAWGVQVVDLTTGAVRFERNPNQLLAPASVAKLFSVAAALVQLGPEDRFRTPVYARGTINEEGVLDGDLILVAQGDLTLGGRTEADGRIAFTRVDHTYASFSGRAELTTPDPLAGINSLAKQISEAGIRRVKGEIFIDDRLFEPTTSTGSGPEQVTPILINDNLIDFTIEPTRPGVPARVTWRPQCRGLLVDARIDTEPLGDTKVQITSVGTRGIQLRGQISVTSEPAIFTTEVPSATSFARVLLIEALERAGVTVDASILADNVTTHLPAATEYAGAKRVAEFASPPFKEHAKLILKVSHNLHASTLPLLLAVKQKERTLEAGLRRQKQILADLGVDTEALSFGGGAGGSRADMITPRATVQLLRAMANRPEFPAFLEALPQLGVDGTLARAIEPACPLRGKVQAKTGTLMWRDGLNERYLCQSKALAGYMTTAKNERLAFAFLVNNVPLAKGRDAEKLGKTLARLCEILYGS